MQYKNYSSISLTLRFIIKEIILLSLFLLQSMRSNILLIITIILFTIIKNVVYFYLYSHTVYTDIIFKNLMSIFANSLISIYLKNIWIFLLLFILNIYRSYIQYSFKNTNKKIIFVGSLFTYQSLIHTYANQEYDLIYDAPNDLYEVIFEYENEYLNYILNTKNTNTIHILKQIKSLHALYELHYLPIIKVEQDISFWNNKHVYILSNDINVCTQLVNTLRHIVNVNIHILTINATLYIPNIDIQILNTDNVFINIEPNSIVIDIFEIQYMALLNKIYLKVWKYLNEIQNIKIWNILTHDLSLESFLASQAKSLCYMNKTTSLYAGVIYDNLHTNITNIRTMNKYGVITINNLVNIIVYEMYKFNELKLLLHIKNTIDVNIITKLFNLQNIDIYAYDYTFTTIKAGKNYDAITMNYMDNSITTTLINNLINGQTQNIGSKIFSNMKLI